MFAGGEAWPNATWSAVKTNSLLRQKRVPGRWTSGQSDNGLGRQWQPLITEEVEWGEMDAMTFEFVYLSFVNMMSISVLPVPPSVRPSVYLFVFDACKHCAAPPIEFVSIYLLQGEKETLWGNTFMAGLKKAEAEAEGGGGMPPTVQLENEIGWMPEHIHPTRRPAAVLSCCPGPDPGASNWWQGRRRDRKINCDWRQRWAII